MADQKDTPAKAGKPRQGFFESLLRGLLRDILWLLSAFSIATAVTAAVFWFYGIPLALSIIGGLFVLGLALAIKTGGNLLD